MGTLILPPIDQSLVSYTPGQPEFLNLVSQTVGNAADTSDGFDAAVNAVMALFPDADQAIADIDATLGDIQTASAAFPDWSSICKHFHCPPNLPGHGMPPIPSLPCDFP